jgi:HlyD family secretion protein
MVPQSPRTPARAEPVATLPDEATAYPLVPQAETLPAATTGTWALAEPLRLRVARHRWQLAAALVVLVAAALGGARYWLGPQVPVESVVRRDIVQTVVASGRVESPHRVDIGSQVTGTVARVPVEEGQDVAQDTPLVLLDDRELRAAVTQADLAVTQAESRLRQLREVDAPAAQQAVRQAQANHANASRTLQRNRDLFAQAFIGQAALDESARAELVASALLRTAEQQLASVRAGGSGELNAVAALRSAQAAAGTARVRLSYGVLRAPVAGTLIARNVEAGDVVQPGKALMVLSPAGETQVVLQIDEKNMRMLHVGQSALASADAYPDQRFPARVAYINPGVDAQRGAVEVKLDLPAPPAYLREDMTVSVDIEVARRKNAVLVPADALHDPEGTAPWVLQAVGGRVQRQPVELGLRSAGWCEIVRGLQPGDQVIRASGTHAPAVTPGARVRPVRTGG